MRSPMLSELAALDPARDLQAPGSADDDALAEILAQPRVAPAGERRPARRPRRAATVAGAAAAVAVAVVVTTVTLDSPAAYASWVPVPADVDEAEAAQRSEPCGGTVTEIVEGPDGPDVQEVAVAPVLTDVRGDYTYVVVVGEDAFGECFVTAPDDGGEPQVVTSSAVVPELPAPGARELTTRANGTATWSEVDGTEGALTSAFGQVGEDVTAVELTLTSGERVVATVSEGWWAVWAPGGSALGSTAEVTYSDGTTEQVGLG
jgi:hypothetical protein